MIRCVDTMKKMPVTVIVAMCPGILWGPHSNPHIGKTVMFFTSTPRRLMTTSENVLP